MAGTKGATTVVNATKGAGALLIFGISYINHIFSPLIWAVLVLAGLDLLMNVHKEGQQLNKIGSAFASIGGMTILSNHMFAPDVLHTAVGLMVLVYLQIVVPQLVGVISKARWIAPGTKAAAIAALEAENAALKKQAAANVPSNQMNTPTGQ